MNFKLLIGIAVLFLSCLSVVYMNSSSCAPRPTTKTTSIISAYTTPPNQGYVELQWVDGFPRDCYGNASSGHQCQADVTVSLMIAETYALSTKSVAMFGMWGKRKRQFGDPIVYCATEHNPTEWVKASMYIIRFFDPFNWFEALCVWDHDVFLPKTTTYLTLKGSAVIKKVAVQGFIETPKPQSGIAICLSQFHNDISERLLIEFLEYYRILGVSSVFIYDFDLRFNTLKLLKEYQQLRDVSITLINWAPVQRYPSYCRGQILALNDCYMRARTVARYVLQIDLDEFVFSASYSAVNPENTLAEAAEAWTETANGNPFVVIFPRYDYQIVCGRSHHENPLGLALPQLTLRCEFPSTYAEGFPRSHWKIFVQNGFSWGGFPKYMIPTDWDVHCGNHRCGALHVHTIQENRRGHVLRILPELDEWRINHYRGWTLEGTCRHAEPSPKPCLVFLWHLHGGGDHGGVESGTSSQAGNAESEDANAKAVVIPGREEKSHPTGELCSLASNQQKLVRVRVPNGMWICRKKWSGWVEDTSMDTMGLHLTSAISDSELLTHLFSNRTVSSTQFRIKHSAELMRRRKPIAKPTNTQSRSPKKSTKR